MCDYCEKNNLDIDAGMHVECEFCGVVTAWMNTDYVYDTTPMEDCLDSRVIRSRILSRSLACNTCRNILNPKE